VDGPSGRGAGVERTTRPWASTSGSGCGTNVEVRTVIRLDAPGRWIGGLPGCRAAGWDGVAGWMVIDHYEAVTFLPPDWMYGLVYGYGPDLRRGDACHLMPDNHTQHGGNLSS
jgi:hypothetical protein